MNIQTLRKFSLKLDVSGTATVIDNTKLYVGSFGFVGLKVYVPVTQNRTPNSEPLCTVHRTVIDLAGNRKQFNLDKYNLLYVGVKQIEDKQYMLFESLLPKAFTDTEGELELVFNYCELTTNLLGESVVVSRLATNVFRTTVAAGGINNTELNTDLKSQDAAQINANTIAIKSLIDDVENLVKPIDNTLANQVGTAELVIDQITGGLKAINLKGKTGDTGATGLTPNITANATPLPAGASPTVDKSGTIDNPIFTFGLPKGDKGNTGEPFTISKIYNSIVAMNEGYATDKVTIGRFVVIDTGSAEDEENGRLYIKGETQYTYIVDLSGMQGFTGVGISQIVYDSTLTDGSFKYKVTLTNNEVYYFVAPKGEMGNTGQAATITVGNTTTLPAGSVATIQERGTAQDRILDFGIPKGTDGTGTGNTTIYVGGVLTETVEFSSNPQLQLNAKANQATTLAGYGITDAYTKSQVNTIGKVTELNNTFINTLGDNGQEEKLLFSLANFTELITKLINRKATMLIEILLYDGNIGIGTINKVIKLSMGVGYEINDVTNISDFYLNVGIIKLDIKNNALYYQWKAGGNLKVGFRNIYIVEDTMQ